jgi:hypothetical protein
MLDSGSAGSITCTHRIWNYAEMDIAVLASRLRRPLRGRVVRVTECVNCGELWIRRKTDAGLFVERYTSIQWAWRGEAAEVRPYTPTATVSFRIEGN